MTGSNTFSRRDVLKTLGGVAGVTVAGSATARETGRYVVLTDGNPQRDLEQRGFTVSHELADGDVLLVDGRSDRVDWLRSQRGVEDAAPDRPVRTEIDRSRRLGRSTPVETSADTPAEEAIPDELQPDPPFHPRQWDKVTTDAGKAHEITTGEGARLAMLDTGVYAGHPDIAPNLNEDLSALVTSETVEDDTDVKDPLGHGTHVAGIAAGSGDRKVVGMAPDVELVSIRTAQAGSETRTNPYSPGLSQRLVGLEYAAEIDADVVSSTESYGREIASGTRLVARATLRLIRHAVDRGTLVVQASGNNFNAGVEDIAIPSDAKFRETGEFHPPGNAPGALTVGATTPTMERAFYSLYGRGLVDIAAPGGGCVSAKHILGMSDCNEILSNPTNLIFSTADPESAFYFAYADGNAGERHFYAYHQGTSMATPQVAGAAALVASIAPEAGPETIARALKDGAVGATGDTPFRPGQALSRRAAGSANRYGSELGAGHLNAYNALQSPVLDGLRTVALNRGDDQ